MLPLLSSSRLRCVQDTICVNVHNLLRIQVPSIELQKGTGPPRTVPLGMCPAAATQISMRLAPHYLSITNILQLLRMIFLRLCSLIRRVWGISTSHVLLLHRALVPFQDQGFYLYRKLSLRGLSGQILGFGRD